jgi:hypothetical protein
MIRLSGRITPFVIASRSSATFLPEKSRLRAPAAAAWPVCFAALRACCWRPRACPPFLAAWRRFVLLAPELLDPDDREVLLRALDAPPDDREALLRVPLDADERDVLLRALDPPDRALLDREPPLLDRDPPPERDPEPPEPEPLFRDDEPPERRPEEPPLLLPLPDSAMSPPLKLPQSARCGSGDYFTTTLAGADRTRGAA